MAQEEGSWVRNQGARGCVVRSLAVKACSRAPRNSRIQRRCSMRDEPASRLAASRARLKSCCASLVLMSAASGGQSVRRGWPSTRYHRGPRVGRARRERREWDAVSRVMDLILSLASPAMRVEATATGRGRGGAVARFLRIVQHRRAFPERRRAVNRDADLALPTRDALVYSAPPYREVRACLSVVNSRP